MTNTTLLVALTKRAIAKQLMRAGSPKREAESVAERLPHHELWRKLPLTTRAAIAWKAGTTEPKK